MGERTGPDAAGTGTGRRRDRAAGAPVEPGSELWTTASDPRSLLPGTAAGILQLMLPGLGAGVSDHSNFFDDPFDRIFRSVPLIWGSIFSTDEGEGNARGRHIRDLHTDIKGVDDAGRRYHALDPDVFWWAHATFTWEFLRARALFWVRPPSRRSRERLYAETVTWYRRYGISDRPVPATLGDFRRRFDDICRHELELTPAVAWVLDPTSNPGARGEPLHLPGPLSVLDGLATRTGRDVLRLLVYGCLPDVVRRRFGLRWTHADRFAFVQLCATLRALEPAVQHGALDGLFPEGTPRGDLRRPDRVVVSGPGWSRRGSTVATADAAH
jgi:uncharacterized protein (DUF2236 family)